MILGKKEIMNEIKKGMVKIIPFKLSQVSGASVDLTLSNEFRVFNNKDTDVKDVLNLNKFSRKIKTKKLILEPNDFVLGITKERIKLPSDLCGFLQGRSRFARIGLGIHITANFLHPGINNKQVLEIKNLSNSRIVLRSGEKICQLILERVEGGVTYKGKYKNQNVL
ncbi:MAG: dCTP deaminase [Nanoarchaeota archaeon]|nr:dCTP deaminase [Nanoarchaeota archaeon]